MVGRFQVMAILQAARAKILGLPLDSAKSWGLNRAIFYAAAKRGFVRPELKVTKVKIPEKMIEEKMREKIAKTFEIYHLGDEMAYSVKIGKKRLFMIGNEIQTPEAFYKQIESRFENFERAWEEALNICKSYDKGILKSQRYFYEIIYKPRRDDLAKKWSTPLV